jgi:hypothetical protein
VDLEKAFGDLVRGWRGSKIHKNTPPEGATGPIVASAVASATGFRTLLGPLYVELVIASLGEKGKSLLGSRWICIASDLVGVWRTSTKYSPYMRFRRQRPALKAGIRTKLVLTPFHRLAEFSLFLGIGTLGRATSSRYQAPLLGKEVERVRFLAGVALLSCDLGSWLLQLSIVGHRADSLKK